MAVGSWNRNPCVQLGFLDPRCDRGAVLCRSDPVVIAVADEGRACDRAEPVPHVMPFAGFELGPMSSRGRGVQLSCGQAFGQRPIRWVIVKPVLVPTAVNDLEPGCNPFLGRELEQLLQRIRGPAFATGGGARQREALDPLRAGYRKLLRHHSTKLTPNTRQDLQPAVSIRPTASAAISGIV